MSSTAIALFPARNYSRRARSSRNTLDTRAPVARPWSQVAIAGAVTLQAIEEHPAHIRRNQFVALIIAALLLHAGLAWYVAHHLDHRQSAPQKNELNIELVRPPKPIEPPKVEPPKPEPPKPRPQQAQVLPQIQQSDPLPSTVGESTEAPVAVAPIISAPPAPVPEVATPPIGRAGYLNNPPPDYPPQAVRQGWQGTVLLHVYVLANGKVDSVEVKKSTGKKILDDEAIRTVKRWLFTPSKRGDVAVDGYATVPIEFLLDQ
jgi:periplasmic protein TonB